jgi:hypothetical protein
VLALPLAGSLLALAPQVLKMAWVSSPRALCVLFDPTALLLPGPYKGLRDSEAGIQALGRRSNNRCVDRSFLRDWWLNDCSVR